MLLKKLEEVVHAHNYMLKIMKSDDVKKNFRVFVKKKLLFRIMYYLFVVIFK